MEPLAVSVSGARQALSLGRTKLYELINDGSLDTLKVGRRTLVTVASMNRLVLAEVGQRQR